MFAPNATFPRMTASEESNLILQEIFEYDSEGMNLILNELCEENGIAFDWDSNGAEIDNLIIDNEDEIQELYRNYQIQTEISDVPEIAEEAVETVDSSEFIDF